MNHIYRVVWNASHRAWVVAGEFTRAFKKGATVGAALILSSFVTEAVAWNPFGGEGSQTQADAVSGSDDATEGAKDDSNSLKDAAPDPEKAKTANPVVQNKSDSGKGKSRAADNAVKASQPENGPGGYQESIPADVQSEKNSGKGKSRVAEGSLKPALASTNPKPKDTDEEKTVRNLKRLVEEQNLPQEERDKKRAERRDKVVAQTLNKMKDDQWKEDEKEADKLITKAEKAEKKERGAKLKAVKFLEKVAQEAKEAESDLDVPADDVKETEKAESDLDVPADGVQEAEEARDLAIALPVAKNRIFASNLEAVNSLFNTRLHDRQGGGWYTDPVTGKPHQSNMWVRAVGGHRQAEMKNDTQKTTANRMVFQAGADLLTTRFTDQDAFYLGAMGGYGKQSAKTSHNVSGEVNGYSTGLYATWYQNNKDKTGLYADSWVLYNWFDNSVNVKDDSTENEKYKSKGMTASLEAGYVIPVGSSVIYSGMENSFSVRPHGQLIWSGVKTDEHTDSNGDKVKSLGNNNLQTRLGMRMSMTSLSQFDKGKARQFEPFIEANWIHNTQQYGVEINGDTAQMAGTHNLAEVKLGVEAHLNQNLSLWGNAGQQFGKDNYRNTEGTLGIKYQF